MAIENKDFLRSILRMIKTVEPENRNPYMVLGEIKMKIEKELN